ncbi:1-acyl-sn-glycerol-3-phosphate acyltransferase [Janthinobacterium sp. BJB1]|uniref:lysophospholipid acyltransferase family protein n=1 Tax=Janthinobacterium sp. GW458P TaxID=1981504 RepID=UPI000A327F17|nr:lysophospholipid acyltransferase family protein [Janthinobacterium sp. GW458P]MBE3023122.1 1-acyl-sn-glycerol-3-phosphate acyltransferase [Janthinobacterium sp. GW458P]PHV16284.1 1-acyl-sn-glycerol-3-phosphate acyltransferase [Janthinobacterium sp. BJB303]PJC95938.1 1-acyl-sn-glycerol-3-phosphate acyltransferase [Janthinobacterium sp. BJB1]
MRKLAHVRTGVSVGWRIFATGLSFAAFGVGGLLLRVLVFPMLHVLVWRREARIAGARAIIRWSFRFYIGLMRLLGVLRYDLRGLDKLERGGLLILANHPTLIDTIFLMAYVKQADCIVKSDLWNNPFTRGPVRAAGYINNTGGAELVEACLASLARGNNLIIFPEGTRTPRSGEILLKRGAANIAVRGRRDVTPVLIRCLPRTLGKGEQWWRVPARRAHFEIAVQDDLAIDEFTGGGASDVLAARTLTNHLQHYFSGKQEQHA